MAYCTALLKLRPLKRSVSSNLTVSSKHALVRKLVKRPLSKGVACRFESDLGYQDYGDVAEWPNASPWKGEDLERGP